MHIAMRKYRQIKGTPEDAVRWVKKAVVPTLKKAKGFRAYYAVTFDDGMIGSINVFASEATANAANEKVKKAVGDGASDMLQHKETKVWQVLYHTAA
jgi:hypothetical protein